MLSDYQPIVYNTPTEFSEIELYFLHDLHKGSAQFNGAKWEAVKRQILERENRYCIFVGDAMENAIPGSKSDIWEQTMTPYLQKEWVAEQFSDLKDRIIAITDGNHERNRTTKATSLHPLYDCAVRAGLEKLYRPNFTVCDIGVGKSNKGNARQVRYVVFAIHKANESARWSSSDLICGIDIFVSGHDHAPKCVPRAKLVYNPTAKSLAVRNVEVINSGSFLTYGGYAANKMYRPNAETMYKVILTGGSRSITTVGYYV